MRILLTILTSMLIAAPVATTMALQQASVEVAGLPEHVPEQDDAPLQSGCTTLSQAVAQARRQYKGRIVSAETQVSGGRETHVIKILTNDGTVKTVRIPGCRV